MAPLQTRAGHGLLRCPVCRLDLTAAAGALACRNRHCFDLARDGYVNLLRGGRRRPADGGDDVEQLRRRAAFLEAGHFDAIASVIASRLQGARGTSAHAALRVMDAGSGTGHHLARFTFEAGSPVIGLGLDISAAAARHAARRWPKLAFAVADLWRAWPVRDAVADLVISIFAPKHFAEAARVLRPGGWLALACPGPDHLLELRRGLGLMRQQPDKTQRYAEAISRALGPASIAQLKRRLTLDAAAICDVVLMGPNGRHVVRLAPNTLTAPLPVTVDIVVLFARKPSAANQEIDNAAHRNRAVRSANRRPDGLGGVSWVSPRPRR